MRMCRLCKRPTETDNHKATLTYKPICRRCGACKCDECEAKANEKNKS